MSNYKVEMDLTKHVGFKRITVPMLREVVFKNMIISGPGFVEQFMPSSRELKTLNDLALHAVNRGQVIDFGHWTNDFIKQSSLRCGPLYTQGALPMPFTSPWIFIHTWNDANMDKIAEEAFGFDASDRMQTSAYLVHPFPGEKGNHCVDFEICALEGFNIAGTDAIGVGDRVYFDGKEDNETG